MEKELDVLLSSTLAPKRFSEDVFKKTFNVIVDTLISTIYGLETEREVKNIIEDRECINGIPIPGSNIKMQKQDVLLVLGVATVANELDEGNTVAKGHPSAHIFPTIYVTALENKNTMEEVLDAYIKAYEISSRIASSFQMRDDMHPHGTWGNIGGAVARGILLKKSNQEIKKIIELALSIPLATNWKAAELGQSVRNLYTGIGNILAYESVDYMNHGFESNHLVIESLWTNVMGNQINLDKLTEKILKPPLITRNYFKVHPTCRFTHAAIEAVEISIKDRKATFEAIESITINTYNLAARCDSIDIKTKLQSKFSIPYAVSCIVMDLNLYNEYTENLSKIGNFMEKIVVNSDDNLTSQLPDNRAAECVIKLSNGSELRSFVDNARGEYIYPFSRGEMIDKYINMLSFQKKYDEEWLNQLLFSNNYEMNFSDWLKQNDLI